ncbi:hypothetical protein GRC93_09650, partial [Streptococcus thermophilus]|nr:hypothetical protein [Streptococcus thermophilus]
FLLLSFSIILPYLIVDLKLCNRTLYSLQWLWEVFQKVKKSLRGFLKSKSSRGR